MPISAARFDTFKSFGESMLAIVGPKGRYTHVELSGEAIAQIRMLDVAPELLAALEQFHMAMVLGNISFRTAEIEVAALDLTRNAIAKAKGIAS